MRLKDWLRLRYGRRWQHDKPTLGELKQAAESYASSALIVLVLFVLYGIVGRMDYEDQLLYEKEAAARQQEDSEYRLRRCLNGQHPGLYYLDSRGNRIEVMCEKAWELNLGKQQGE